MSLRRFGQPCKSRTANAALAADGARCRRVFSMWKQLHAKDWKLTSSCICSILSRKTAFINHGTLSLAHCPAFKPHLFQKCLFNQPPHFIHGTNCPKADKCPCCSEMFYTWLWKRLCMTHEHQGFLQWMHKYVEKEEVKSSYLQARTGETHF